VSPGISVARPWALRPCVGKPIQHGQTLMVNAGKPDGTALFAPISPTRRGAVCRTSAPVSPLACYACTRRPGAPLNWARAEALSTVETVRRAPPDSYSCGPLYRRYFPLPAYHQPSTHSSPSARQHGSHTPPQSVMAVSPIRSIFASCKQNMLPSSTPGLLLVPPRYGSGSACVPPGR